jgi:hypothetical protein
MRQFHFSKGVVAFLPWPINPGNFVTVFAMLNVCRTFYLTPLRLVLTNENTHQ